VPQAVGGPSGHPPKVEEITLERINKKEKRAALVSAIAACARKDLVGARHVLGKELNLPVVIEDRFEQIGKTKQVVGVLSAIGIVGDIDSAKGKRRIRAGKGKRRGRKVKQKKSILIVTKDGARVFRAARNIPGVDICVVRNLNASLLAPGAMPGRLTVWSEGAIKALGQERAQGKAKRGEPAKEEKPGRHVKKDADGKARGAGKNRGEKK
jgi:large subunit ribosomal protein L4e